MTAEERMDPARCKNDTQRNHIKNVARSGLSILHVLEGQDPSTPEWSYTIGLWHTYKHPEVVLIGLKAQLSQIILNNLNVSIRDEQRSFLNGTSADDILEGYRCYFDEVPQEDYGDWFAADEWFYGDTAFPAVQLLWPNTSGVYPWDKEADEYLRWVQPILSATPPRG